LKENSARKCTSPRRDHRAVRFLPVYAREEYLVIGHALLGEVETLRLVGQLVDGKLALGEHLFPGNAQKLKQMFPEGTMIFVSHDRMFLRGLGSRVLELGGESGTDRNPTVYPGSYVEYVQKLGHEAPGIYS
jgi:hypothetical protein